MKKNFYDVNDAGKVFFWIILTPQIFGLVIYFTLLCIASSTGLDFNQLLLDTSQSYAFIMLSQVAFAMVFILYNRHINIKMTCKINKISIKNIIICIIIAIVALIGFLPISNLFVVMLEQMGLDFSTSLPFEFDSFGSLLLAIFSFALIPAIVEELIFRGVILQGLMKFGKWTAIIGSAALFALVHASAIQLVFPFLFSIILAMVVLKTGSVVSAIICHFVSNATSLIITYFNSGAQEEVLTIDASLVIISIISIALVFYIVNALLKYAKNEDKYQFIPRNCFSKEIANEIEEIVKAKDYNDLEKYFENEYEKNNSASEFYSKELESYAQIKNISETQNVEEGKNSQKDELDFEYKAFMYYNFLKKRSKVLTENNDTFWLKWGIGIGLMVWIISFSTYFV